MMKRKRLEFITEQIYAKGDVNVIELSKQLDVSTKTIRLDLNVLERANVLTRVHGGAITLEHINSVIPTSTFRDRFNQAKIEIANEALKLIQENDVILLDDGSSTLELAKLLGEFRVTVLTNDMLIVQEFLHKPKVTLFVIGGLLKRDGDAYVVSGEDAISFIRKYRVNKAFLGTSTIDIEKGLMVFYYGDRATKRAFIASSNEVICLADSSKFNQTAFTKFADIGEIDLIITDSRIDKKCVAMFRDVGVKVNVAKKLL